MNRCVMKYALPKYGGATLMCGNGPVVFVGIESSTDFPTMYIDESVMGRTGYQWVERRFVYRPYGVTFEDPKESPQVMVGSFFLDGIRYFVYEIIDLGR